MKQSFTMKINFFHINLKQFFYKGNATVYTKNDSYAEGSKTWNENIQYRHLNTSMESWAFKFQKEISRLLSRIQCR